MLLDSNRTIVSRHFKQWVNLSLMALMALSSKAYSHTGNHQRDKVLVLEHWSIGQGRFWDEQHWFAGDFDGDGVEEIARAFNDVRKVSIDVYRSDKTKFTRENWVAQQGRFWETQHWRAGDFNGDGADDVARILKDGRNVSIDVYISTKKGFTLKNWVSQQGRYWDEQYWRVGDFDGDGVDDIARVFNDGRTVSIDVYSSNKSSFIQECWAQKQGRFWVDQIVRAGDFNGDGVDDLARIFNDGRKVSIDVFSSNKKSFHLENWVSQKGRFWVDQHWFAGDFDGDGTEDIARVYKDDRDSSFDLYRSSKKGFELKPLVVRQGRFWTDRQWRAGDFNGDGNEDIAKIFKDGRNVSIDVHLSKK